MSVFSQLDDTELAQLIEALQRDRLALPISRFSLSRYISEVNLEAITAELQRLIQQNWKTATLLYLLEAIATERNRAITLERTAELVWTHPDRTLANSRDTHVIALNLIQQARSSLTISTYSFDDNDRGKNFLAPLAEHYKRDRAFALRIFCNIKQKWGETHPPEYLTTQFARRFRDRLWSGDHLPPIYYDPRALLSDWTQRACLHTKCIIADRRFVLLTSANFTEASRKRNIETGILLTSSDLAKQPGVTQLM
jgi:phosphatidylserine/phosphatidylglycerophosphate/cardiolipin synthase-like enzyme